MGASSSTSSPASEDDADLAAVTACCIISRTPSLDEPPLLTGPLPLALLADPAEPLPFAEEVAVPSGKTLTIRLKIIISLVQSGNRTQLA